MPVDPVKTYYIVSALAGAITSTANSFLSRKQQRTLAADSKETNLALERNRQQFTAEQNEANMEKQRELALLNHDMRIKEQEYAFQNVCSQAEWSHFMSQWPLVTPPSVIREEQILPDHTVSLRVIFSRSKDPVFAQAVYPVVEQGLLEFVDIYHNIFRSQNIIFYHNAFIGNTSGGAVNSNIRHVLKGLPVIIIDTNILLDEICVDLTMWGLGTEENKHFTAFKIPYHVSKDLNDYRELSDRMLAYLKFVLGYAYDAFNLIEYGRVPLLPDVASLEYQENVRGSILQYEELKTLMTNRISELYVSVLGDARDEETAVRLFPERGLETFLHKLRLDYAESVEPYVEESVFTQFLSESLDAWVSLRSHEEKETFLPSMAKKLESKHATATVRQYFSAEDKEYIARISAACSRLKQPPDFVSSLFEIDHMLKELSNVMLVRGQISSGSGADDLSTSATASSVMPQKTDKRPAPDSIWDL